MHVAGTDTRHRADLQTEHGGGLEVEDMNASSGVLSSTGHYISKKRLREQQECREYWAAMYGHRAEVESRGGVNWID